MNPIKYIKMQRTPKQTCTVTGLKTAETNFYANPNSCKSR